MRLLETSNALLVTATIRREDEEVEIEEAEERREGKLKVQKQCRLKYCHTQNFFFITA